MDSDGFIDLLMQLAPALHVMRSEPAADTLGLEICEESLSAHIHGLSRDTIDWNLMRTHWRDLTQALSIYIGRISSPILLRKLSHYSRKNRLYLAAQELGRVQRTIYLLRWISDISLRSSVTAGTNTVEGYHALTKWLQFGVERVIQDKDPDEQQQRIRYLGHASIGQKLHAKNSAPD